MIKILLDVYEMSLSPLPSASLSSFHLVAVVWEVRLLFGVKILGLEEGWRVIYDIL